MLKINVLYDGKSAALSAYRGESISELLKKEGILISQPCLGKGKCGKCVVKVLNRAYPYDEADIKLVGEKAVNEGLRLLCRMKAIRDVEIELKPQKKFDILADFENKYLDFNSEQKGFAICLDIGTTTLAAQLINLRDGKIVKVCSKINSQATFGADVVSRMEASLKGNKEELEKIIKLDIMGCFNELCTDILKCEVKKIILAGNTVMTYLLLGMDCKDISQFPFKCNFNDLKKYCFKDIFGNDEFNADVYIINCLSAFVGGDIVSGAVFCALLENKNSLFIDIGTNAEMAVFNGEKLFICSAPAGPVFEGGEISCGMASVEGAICSASFDGKIWSYETINKAKAVGICGSGLIDAVAAIIENNIVDKNGLICEKYFDSGIKIGKNVKISQADIRKFQLAKAAVRAGIKILLKKADIELCDIKSIFLSGGFGSKINTRSAFRTGLLPAEFEGKICSVGNSSLGGLRDIALIMPLGCLENIKKAAFDINLAQINDFNDIFMEEINF